MAHTTMPSDALCHYNQYYQNYEQLIAKTLNYITIETCCKNPE